MQSNILFISTVVIIYYIIFFFITSFTFILSNVKLKHVLSHHYIPLLKGFIDPFIYTNSCLEYKYYNLLT